MLIICHNTLPEIFPFFPPVSFTQFFSSLCLAEFALKIDLVDYNFECMQLRVFASWIVAHILNSPRRRRWWNFLTKFARIGWDDKRRVPLHVYLISIVFVTVFE